MTSKTPPVDVGRGKPGVAAAIFIVAFVLSATMMIWSGWQLYHGEKLPLALTETGTQCQWVLLVDDPAKAPAAWEALRHVDLPAAATPLWQALQPLFVDAGRTHLDAKQAWVLCGQPDGAVLTVANGPQQPEAARELVHLLAVEPRQPNALVAWQDGAVVEDGKVLRVVFAKSEVDAQALIERAKPHGPPETASLAVDLPFRASTERVGDAPLHLYLPQATARAWLKTLLPLAWWQGGIDVVQWLGVMVRQDDQKLRVHAHLGGDEQMGAWLKPNFDVSALDDAAPWIAASASAAAIVRMPAATRPQLAGWYGPSTPLFQAVLQTPPADLPAATLIWQQFADHSEAALWRGTAQGPKAWQHLATGDWTVVGTDDAAIGRVRDALNGASSQTDDRDRRRLLDSTQGWFTAHVQVDWVWTDSGLAAEAAWQLLPK
jgi:hypothetical protein